MAQRITATQAFTANSQNKDVDVSDVKTIALTISGTYALTTTFYASVDGTNFFIVGMTNATTGAIASTHSAANASQAYKLDVTPFTKFRVGTTAYTSGTGNVVVSGLLEQN